MAANKVELQEAILKAVDAVVTQRNNELKLDKTVTAIIKKNVGVKHGKPVYQVEYSGGLMEATTQNADDSYVPHTSVYVMVPEGNFSNEKIIIGRAASIKTDRSSSVVAAAVNKYSIVGSNLLESNSLENIADIQFGLRSFHPRSADASHGIEHRACFVYQADNESNLVNFRNDKLNVYKEDTTAIMIKADFRTNLDVAQKRQAGAQYGLIFNFAFDNLNKGYGETNREILETVGNIVTGKYEKITYLDDQIIDTKIVDTNLLHLVEDFENSLELGNDLNYYINDNTGKIDQTIEYIKTMYSNFQTSFPELDKEIIHNTIDAYLILLQELKNLETLTDINEQYQNWLSLVVGDDSQKNISFVLDSNSMIGNPMSFSTWNTQYSVFKIDLDTFNHLDSILFYKEGFLESEKYENQWPIGVQGGGPDIFVKNIQVYAMNPLDQQSGNYTIKVEPSNGQDIIISSANPKTQFRATVLRKMYEDLTRNDNMQYIWFKEDSAVTSANAKGYHYLGGVGWRKLEHNEANYLFSTDITQNRAYKNNYKCVAVYEPSIDDKTILSYTFSIYNKDAAIDLKLESDIGTAFSFDAGSPTIKVLINEDRINNDTFTEIGFAPDAEDINRLYKYEWAIADVSNTYTLFLDEVFEEVKFSEADASEAILLSSKKSLLNKIKAYTAYYDNDELKVEEVIEAYKATRIKYPVAIGSSGFTVFCYLKKYDNGEYYDVGSASLSFLNNDGEMISDYRIQIINGDQVFQYDEYGNSPCLESKKDPLEIKPLQAKLLTPSGVEVEGSNYTVEWIFPIEDSMLSTADSLSLNPITNLNQNHIGSELTFSIADLYNPDALNNQITCHVYFNEKNYYKDTTFYIGKQGNNGTNGTDVVAKIDVVGADPLNVLGEQPLTLYVQKGIRTQGMWNIDSSRQLSETIDLINDNIGLKLNVYQKGILLSEDSYDEGYPHWNLAGNASQTRQTAGKFFSIEEDASQLRWDYSYNIENSYRLQNIRAEVSLNKHEQTYYAFFSLPIIEYEERIDGLNIANLLTKNRIAIDKRFYLKEVIYNQDGRNPIYNHNQGLKLINIPKNITRIVFKAKGGWSSNYSENNPDFSLLLDKEDNESVKSNEIEITEFTDNAMVYIIPNDVYGGSQTNNRIEAELYNEDNLIATVYVPIHMALNTFGLASLNAWDGNTVKIDEDNGYIMAPQMGAGEKDSNNRFTGVLMGKTETYTGGAENEKEIGLFGYAHGLQSIFLDSETGNATFGLPDNYIFDKTSGTPVPVHGDVDNYAEGRIELRPGDESKIGGWRIGRRSLYYTTRPSVNSPKDYKYVYDGTIGDKYSGDIGTPSNKQYGEHHIKDIKTQDGGLLLSADPPYISVKGQKLTEDEIDNGLNSQLRPGDSLEIQLDPQTPTLFTIFRHNSENRAQNVRGKRQFLAGINDKGELLANGVGREDSGGTGTKSGNIILKAFKDTKDMESGSYVGSVFEAGSGLASTRTFFQIFREKENPLDTTSQVYMTGGQQTSSGEYQSSTGDEYLRPISIHGKSLQLYARTGLNDSNNIVQVKPGLGKYIKNIRPIKEEEIGVYVIDREQYIEVEEGNGKYAKIEDEEGNEKYEPQKNGNYIKYFTYREKTKDEQGTYIWDTSSTLEGIPQGYTPIDIPDGKEDECKQNYKTYIQDYIDGIEQYVADYIEAGYNWTSTDANIQISTNDYQTQLGNTLFKLTRDQDNLLETRGDLKINLGATGNRESFEFNASDSTVNLFTGGTNYYSQTIDDTNGIKIDTSKPYEYFSTHSNYKIQLDSNKLEMNDKKIQFGSINSNITNLITMDQDNSSWKIGHDLTLESVNQLKIYATNTGNGSQYSSSRTWGQIVLQAGTIATDQTAAQLFLNSSNNTWTSEYEYIDSNGKKQKKPKNGNKTNSWFRVNETRRSQGIFLYDTVEKVNNKDTVYTYFRIDAHQLSLAGQFSMDELADKLFFESTKIDSEGVVNRESNPKNGYIAEGTNLAKLISDCLKAANDAKAAADAAQTKANSAYTAATNHTHTVTVKGTTSATATISSSEVKKAVTTKATVRAVEHNYYSTDKEKKVSHSLNGFKTLSNGETYQGTNSESPDAIYLINSVESTVDTANSISKTVTAEYSNTVTTDRVILNK